MEVKLEGSIYYENLPDIRLIDVPVPANPRLAFSLPLFHCDMYAGKRDDYLDRYNQMFTKPAIWTAMGLLHNSDLGENGIKCYFHIEDRLEDVVVPYLKEQDVPDDYIRVIALPEKYQTNPEVESTHFGKKFLGLYDDALMSEVEDLFTIDTDMFLCARDVHANAHRLYRDLTSPVIKGQLCPYDFEYVRFNYAYYIRQPFFGAGLTTQELDATGWINEGFDMFESKNMLKPAKIEKYAYERFGLKYRLFENVPASDYVVRPFVSGQIYKIPTAHAFVDFIKEYGHHCYNDESIMSLYFAANSVTPIHLKIATGITMFINENMFNPDEQIYFAHYKDDFDMTPNHLCYKAFYTSALNLLAKFAT